MCQQACGWKAAEGAYVQQSQCQITMNLSSQFNLDLQIEIQPQSQRLLSLILLTPTLQYHQ